MISRALLERPVRPETLLSSVQNALRARFRQYQVRDYVRQQAQAEEALRRTEKLAVAGRLTASIAHEINNPLEAVTNIVWLLQNNPELPVEARDYLRMAQQELDRVTHITKQTLGFYREPSQSAQSMSVNCWVVCWGCSPLGSRTKTFAFSETLILPES